MTSRGVAEDWAAQRATFAVLPVISSSRLTVIDCGAHRTAMGVFRQTRDGLSLETHAIERLPVLPSGDEGWLAQTTAALRALRTRVKPAGRVLLVLPPHLTLTKMIRTPRVSPRKREKIIRYEAAQGIPGALTEVVWAAAPAGENATEMEFLLAAAKQGVVSALGDAATSAGFEPAAMLPSVLATCAACRLAAENFAQPTVVLNIGARSTTLLLIEGGRFAARTLSLGGNGGTLPSAGEVLATRLALEVTRSVLHFNRQGGWGKPSRVRLTGGAAQLPGLVETLARRLELPVDRLAMSAEIFLDGAAALGSGELTDLIGAAKLGFADSWREANLLPFALRRRESLRRKHPWLMAAVGLVAAALLPPIFHYRQLAESARTKTAEIRASLAPVRDRAARNRAALEELHELRAQADLLQDTLERRTAWLGLLGDLQGRLAQAEDVWLDGLQTIPPADDAPLKLAISGRMLDRTNPGAKMGPDAIARLKSLLTSLAESPFVASIENERFDGNQAGILRFDLLLVANPAEPL